MSSFEKNIENVAKKFDLDLDWLRTISPKEILYLLDQCPFLQIVCPDAFEQPVEILTAKTGWKMHFHGDAISGSLGELLFNQEIRGIGTIVKQAWDTTQQMMEIAKNHGWTRVKIVDGHPWMMRAAWIIGEKMNIEIMDFTPSEHDWQVRKQLALTSNELEVLKKSMQLS